MLLRRAAIVAWLLAGLACRHCQRRRMLIDAGSRRAGVFALAVAQQLGGDALLEVADRRDCLHVLLVEKLASQRCRSLAYILAYKQGLL